MAEEKKYSDDEFQFSEETEAASDFVPEDHSEMPAEKVRTVGNTFRRFFLIGIGLFIVVVAVYKMLGLFESKKNSPMLPLAASQPPAAELSAAVVMPLAKAPVVMSPPPPPAIEQPTQDNMTALSELQNKFVALEASVQNNGNGLTTLNATMNNLGTTTSKLDEKINHLSTLIEKLNNDITEQRLAALQAKQKQERLRLLQREKKQPLISQLTLQAVIPGRAWLVDEEGSTQTVREGSDIAGYGKVLRIDPYQGLVMLDNGKTIGFSQDDL